MWASTSLSPKSNAPMRIASSGGSVAGPRPEQPPNSNSADNTAARIASRRRLIHRYFARGGRGIGGRESLFTSRRTLLPPQISEEPERDGKQVGQCAIDEHGRHDRGAVSTRRHERTGGSQLHDADAARRHR